MSVLQTRMWAGCFGVLLTFVGLAHGQGIVVFQPNPAPPYSMAGFPNDYALDINNDGTADFILRSQDPDTSVNNAFLVPLGFNSIVASVDYVSDMNPGETVGPSLTPIYSWTTSKSAIGTLALLAGDGFAEDGNFVGKTDGYIGFDLVSDGQNHYGWMYITSPGAEGLTGDAGLFGNVTEWAYETSPNTPIVVGAVPEPPTWALLVFGGGVIRWLAVRRESLNTPL